MLLLISRGWARQDIGQQIDPLPARTIREIDAAFTRLAEVRADALLIDTDLDELRDRREIVPRRTI
jgi:hypothetical protein